MWYIIIGILALIYILINLVLPGNIDGQLMAYVIRPALWVGLAVAVYKIAKDQGTNIWSFKKTRRWEIGKNPFQAALLIGGFQISLLVIFGLLSGFGESPYAFTPIAIITNIIFVGTLLVATELSRSFLMKSTARFAKKNITLMMLFVTMIFVIISITPTEYQLLNFNDPKASITLIGGTIIPLITINLFACYMVYLGGAKASLGYMAILTGFQWFSPVLPNLDWALEALVGTIAPAVGFLVIQNSIQITQKMPKSKRKKSKKKDPTLSWTSVAAICVVFVFFSTGLLGVQPTVIYSGSMRSALDVGDVVIVSEVPIDELQEGIIQFKNEDMSIPVVHRIYDITTSDGNIIFVTKGDDNDGPDRVPVLPSHINGKVVFNLPKVGWVPIIIKEFIYKITTVV